MCGKSACTVRRGEGPKPIGPSYPYPGAIRAKTAVRRSSRPPRPPIQPLLTNSIAGPHPRFVLRGCIRKADGAWAEAALVDGLADTTFCRRRRRRNDRGRFNISSPSDASVDVTTRAAPNWRGLSVFGRPPVEQVQNADPPSRDKAVGRNCTRVPVSISICPRGTPRAGRKLAPPNAFCHARDHGTGAVLRNVVEARRLQPASQERRA